MSLRSAGPTPPTLIYILRQDCVIGGLLCLHPLPYRHFSILEASWRSDPHGQRKGWCLKGSKERSSHNFKSGGINNHVAIGCPTSISPQMREENFKFLQNVHDLAVVLQSLQGLKGHERSQISTLTTYTALPKPRPLTVLNDHYQFLYSLAIDDH